jgi:hypothetical protein
MADLTVANVGEKLIVGQLDTSFLTAGAKLVPGTSVLNGPVFIGLTPQAGIARATCMIGPPLPGVTAPASLEVDGISNFLCATNQLGAYTCTGASVFDGANVANGTIVVNSSTTLNGALVVNGATHINGFLSFTSSIVGVTKSFDIKHPNKEGYRLKHGCIEGPEYGVYYRGRLKKSNVIELPSYWIGLINPETITVNLTSHTVYQELFIKDINSNKIFITNNSGGIIDCSYVVYAERSDVNKLIVEYESDAMKENDTVKQQLEGDL